VVRFGSDYDLLGSFLPRKTQKQIRKRYRYILAHRGERLEKMEEDLRTQRRKAYFDQQLEDNEHSFTSSSPSLDLSPQSLQ
jgi:hypothetical protein